MSARPLTLCLAGDAMTGRGIDQALAHPGEPTLHEGYVRDARDYLRLAERASGAMAAPIDGAALWGEALAAMTREQPALRIVNLETAVTASATPWPGKGIHYRMHPRNIEALTAASIDVAVLANNHVLDWSHAGLAETLHTLQAAGVRCVGAGDDEEAAWAPLRLAVGGGTQVLVFALTFADAGTPADWAATPLRAGVAWLDAPSPQAAERWAAHIARYRRAGDIVIASVHWGENWVARLPAAQRDFAQRLIASGAVDLLHGHSSHHPLPIEVQRGRAVVHGCGDLINDYEGIGPHGRWRADLGALYFADLDRASGALLALRVVPLRRRRFRLVTADESGRSELLALLNAPQRPPIAARVEAAADGSWHLQWQRR